MPCPLERLALVGDQGRGAWSSSRPPRLLTRLRASIWTPWPQTPEGAERRGWRARRHLGGAGRRLRRGEAKSPGRLRQPRRHLDLRWGSHTWPRSLDRQIPRQREPHRHWPHRSGLRRHGEDRWPQSEPLSPTPSPGASRIPCDAPLRPPAPGRRLHMVSLSGAIEVRPSLLSSYDTFLRATHAITRHAEDVAAAYRRTVFNVLACNRDDHTRQHSFLMSERGDWRLAPAYDLTFSAGPGGEHYLDIEGKADIPPGARPGARAPARTECSADRRGD
uniref:HipA domain-containing protein n=1 Tax=Phenylobacterium glaciei TaxID=2803784 RepID=A0A974P5H9_9CAUL|nr:HipA domain-containing protein [Phenylobacterium glaciei]